MKYIINKELSDPDWVHNKQQDYFNFKAALQRFEWGAAYIPEACRIALYNIRREVERMDDPIKAWKPVKKQWMNERRGNKS